MPKKKNDLTLAWEDPPTKVKDAPEDLEFNWPTIIAELEDHPNQWAKLGNVPFTFASELRASDPLLADKEIFEIARDGKDFYIRYVS